jgi:hypothetical protein
VKLTIRPLTHELWPDLEDLFGPSGASNGCWCMYWRLGAGYHKRPREENKADFRALVKRGPPPGLLAFNGKLAVATALIEAALKAAKRAKALALEAYPIDTAAPKSSCNLFTGTAAAFARAGFRTVARRAPDRPVMRYDL